MPTFPRETKEHLPVTVKVDNAVMTVGVTFSITAAGIRPVTFVPSVAVDGLIGVMIQNLEPGTYNVWAKVALGTEDPVINCGQFKVN